MEKHCDIKELVLASRNNKKIEEIRRITAELGIVVRSIDEFPDCHDVDETANTFEGNSLKKAREICACTGLPALADDSGLEVDALDKAPGVYSARYAGTHATDAQNVIKLLASLGDSSERSARFRCVIALVSPDGKEVVFDGKVEGTIAQKQQGDNGFGYDPIFFPEGYEPHSDKGGNVGVTFAQMDAAQKDAQSHRGRALEKFIHWLKNL